MNLGLESALELLPSKIKDLITSLEDRDCIDEIRLRFNRPLSISIKGENRFVLKEGGHSIIPINSYISTLGDIEHVFKASFSYSLHTYSKELSCGYITTRGGNRVGICGTAVMSSNELIIDTIKYIQSINIRISREIIGIAENFYSEVKDEGVLIIGPPCSGKTTILRDMTRLIGNEYRTSLIDELNEISCTYRSEPICKIGNLTDVFVGYPKAKGIENAIRSMSPQFIVVDEIGTDDDTNALRYAYNCGAKLISAIHSDSLDHAVLRSGVKELIDIKAFKYAVILKEYSYNSHEYDIKRLY